MGGVGLLEREFIRLFAKRYAGNARVVLITSLILNLLMFAGSIYMLLVYDSVLPSGSIPTLAGLFVMLVLLYALQAAFEMVRSEALLTIANGVHRDLFASVHHAAVTRSLKGEKDALQLTRDLDQVHTFLAGTGPIAIIDLPWVAAFLIVLFALHWSLGLAALFGALVLAAIAWITARRSALGNQRMMAITGRRLATTQAELRFAESAIAMGMQDRLRSRSALCDADYIDAQSYFSRTVARLGGAGRVFRIFVQSLILSVGALLVIDNKATGGIIIASSVLAGRALAPVDLAIANWKGLSAASEGWSRLVKAITLHTLPEPRQVTLARPSGDVVVKDIWVAPPGAQSFVLNGVSMVLQPGQAVAIIGPSAAGKTSLAKALLGIWKPARGEIRIDGATHDQWTPDAIGAAMGYVPQAVELMEGTLGENIARFDPDATSDSILAAAKAAGLHETILGFANGYETAVSTGGGEFSAGQRQRIGLARALYGDPHLVVLDEPNSNLDAEGDAALATAIAGVRKRGGIVVMITHRPATLGPVSAIAVLNAGRLVDYGDRDAVLKRLAEKGGAAKPAGRAANGAKQEGLTA
ncbi:MAG: type I secretion system permease/ATPase [Novosphingobium sp.]